MCREKTKASWIVANILAFGPLIGLRPHEWPFASVEGDRLLVRSAKFSIENRRGLQPVRLINLDAHVFTEAKRTKLAAFLLFLNHELKSCGGDVASLMRGPARLLAEIRDHAKVPNITLKTARHQARSNLVKAGIATEEIAALMGHASTATAAAHYGVRGGGWGIDPGVSAPIEVIALVRHVRSGQNYGNAADMYSPPPSFGR